MAATFARELRCGVKLRMPERTRPKHGWKCCRKGTSPYTNLSPAPNTRTILLLWRTEPPTASITWWVIRPVSIAPAAVHAGRISCSGWHHRWCSRPAAGQATSALRTNSISSVFRCSIETAWRPSCSCWMHLVLHPAVDLTWTFTKVTETSCAEGRHNMPRPLQVDRWAFDLESGVWVTCDVGNLCANLVFLCLSVFDLGPMYATEKRQTRIVA